MFCGGLRWLVRWQRARVAILLVLVFVSHDHDDDTISEVFTLIASRGSYVDGRLLSNTEGRWCKQHRGKVVHSFVCNFFWRMFCGSFGGFSGVGGSRH